jgi:hypothetical protein
MSLDLYQRIMDSTSLKQDPQSEISGDQAYYSSRDIPRCRRVAGEDLPFQGSIGRCQCIDCTPVLRDEQREPEGLSGRKIAFEAGSRPTEDVYRRRSVHRGTRGLLRKGSGAES